MDTAAGQHSVEQPYLSRRQNWITQLTRHSLMQPQATALRFLGHTTSPRPSYTGGSAGWPPPCIGAGSAPATGS